MAPKILIILLVTALTVVAASKVDKKFAIMLVAGTFIFQAYFALSFYSKHKWEAYSFHYFMAASYKVAAIGLLAIIFIEILFVFIFWNSLIRK